MCGPLIPSRRPSRRYSAQPRRTRRRQRGGHDLHGVGRAAADDRLARAIEDLPARGGNRQWPHVVGVGLLHVLFAGEHLQEPQAEEDDREHHQRQAAQHRDPQRQLRGDRRRGVAGPDIARPDALDRRCSCAREGTQTAGRIGAAATAAWVVGQARFEAAAHDQPHRQRDDRVHDHPEHDLAQQLEADRRVDAEQELHQRVPDRSPRPKRRRPTSSGVSVACGSRNSRRRPHQ